MKKQLTLGFSPWGNSDSIAPFDRVFEKKQNILKDGFAGVDAVILWGGQDIHPSYYKQKAHPRNMADALPSDRDKFEWKTMLFCKANNIPVIGVCRGAQFVCVGAGGCLVQHVLGHCTDHYILTSEQKKLWATSSHHQMMYPWEIKHELLAWADPWKSNTYEMEKERENVIGIFSKKEPEIVFFPQLKGLAIQPHPEYGNANPEFVSYCLDLVKEYCLK